MRWLSCQRAHDRSEGLDRRDSRLRRPRSNSTSRSTARWPTAERYDLIFDLRPSGSSPMQVGAAARRRHRRSLLPSRRNREGSSGGATASTRSMRSRRIVRSRPCYFLPIEISRTEAIQLRLGPTRNNQRCSVNWAKDFEFAATLGASGAVAQLGERLAGGQGHGFEPRRLHLRESRPEGRLLSFRLRSRDRRR